MKTLLLLVLSMAAAARDATAQEDATMRPRARRHGRNLSGLRPVPRRCFGTAGFVGARRLRPVGANETPPVHSRAILLDRIRGHAGSDRPRPDHIAAVHRGLDDPVGRGRARSYCAQKSVRVRAIRPRSLRTWRERVCTIEIIPQLAEAAAKALRDLAYENVSVRLGDGYGGWPECGPLTPSW